MTEAYNSVGSSHMVHSISTSQNKSLLHLEDNPQQERTACLIRKIRQVPATGKSFSLEPHNLGSYESDLMGPLFCNINYNPIKEGN